LLAFEVIGPQNPLKISLSPIADWGMAEWDIYIEKEAKVHSNREVRNVLDRLPRRLIDALGSAGLVPNTILNQK
jgi:hypothetical protein